MDYSSLTWDQAATDPLRADLLTNPAYKQKALTQTVNQDPSFLSSFQDAADVWSSVGNKMLNSPGMNLLGLGHRNEDVRTANQKMDWLNERGFDWGTLNYGGGDQTAFSKAMGGVDPALASQSWGGYDKAMKNANMFGALAGNLPGGNQVRSGSSIDGISAVNPQAGQANELDAFKRYEDMAYNTALGRLQPQLDQQNASFNQGLVSRGIPVGSDAYNSAMRQKDQSQADALQNAAFGAMQFGLGAQNQSFQQDHARSALANALLQARMQQELGMANVGLGYAGLNQRAQQFQDQLGFNYDTFYDTLANQQYQFDAGQDFNYWDRGNYWDFAYDRAGADDYFNTYDRDFASQKYDDALLLSLFGQAAPGAAPANATSAYGYQLGSATRPGADFLGLLGF